MANNTRPGSLGANEELTRLRKWLESMTSGHENIQDPTPFTEGQIAAYKQVQLFLGWEQQ